MFAGQDVHFIVWYKYIAGLVLFSICIIYFFV